MPPRRTETWEIATGDLPEALRSAREARASRVSLLIYARDGVQVVALRPGRAVVIGRDAPADIQIAEKTLSHQHARFSLERERVWVEDLRSTNGTRIDGERITRRAVSVGGSVTLGAVTVCIHVLGPGAGPGRQLPLDDHDRFVVTLEREIARSRTFRHKLGLVVVRAASRAASADSSWQERVCRLLRPFDHPARYSDSELEAACPETSRNEMLSLAGAIVDERSEGDPPLYCGVGLFPESAGNAEELTDVTRKAALKASDQQRIVLAPSPTLRHPTELIPPRSDDEPVASSPAMRTVFRTIDRLANSSIPVLIYGETGTGKEVVARAIHRRSGRRDGPMLCINCGAIASQLIESVLFGHERGAFTGALQQTKGVFEEADGGTVLLDEIGELSPAAQAALLRVLETKRIARVGSMQEIAVDVRIVAATHRDLEAMCQQPEATFRMDLLYRLNTMTLKLPPLRERREEIEALVGRFIAQANASNGCSVPGIDHAALRILEGYRWPGNVRELRNVIERAVVLANDGAITVDLLSERLRAASEAPSPVEPLRATRRDARFSAPRRSTADHHDAAAPAVDAAEAGAPDQTGAARSAPSAGGEQATAAVSPADETAARIGSGETVDLKRSVRDFEELLLVAELDRTGWNQAEAARRLQMPLRTLFYKVRSYSLKKDEDHAQALLERAAPLRQLLGESARTGFKDAVAAYETRLVRAALEHAGGNKAAAARLLQIATRTLSKKIADYDID